MSTVREIFETSSLGVMATCQAVISQFRERGAARSSMSHPARRCLQPRWSPPAGEQRRHRGLHRIVGARARRFGRADQAGRIRPWAFDALRRQRNHAALRQFSGSTYVGGNFVKTASRDVGLTGRPAQSGFDPLDVDEKKSMWIDAGSCTPVGTLMPPAILGHGTHVAGLLGANGASGLGVQGTCKHCGIQMYRTAYAPGDAGLGQACPVHDVSEHDLG